MKKQNENNNKSIESIVDILRRLRKDPEAMKQVKIVSKL
jgi:hypothetical protein|tara:strand:+ start:1841 stop:1957 length:117 start_codon:yes stop_codon:yes gene_type:complete